LDARQAGLEVLGQALHRPRLRQPGQPLDQQVAVGEQADQQALDDLLLTDDRTPDARLQVEDGIARGHLGWRYCPFGADSCSITRSRLKLAGFCRIGNSLKVCSHCPTIACAGTSRNARSAFHWEYLKDSGPRSNGSASRL